MDGLIIAAGYGSRLRELSDSKPLTPVAGVPLIELGVRRLAACGIARVVVVTGHEGERVEAFLAALAARTGIAIECARVADWSLPNGHSVIAGAARITGDYILQMADHVFAPAIITGLMQQGSPEHGVTLAVDTRTDSPLVDPDDATWVETGDGGLILAIGKTIAAYDAVDCGAFLATPELAAAIAGALADGKAGSLSDGMQRLADAGRAATWDIGTDDSDAWWLDVDDPRAHALAEAEAPARLPDLYRR
ncbi:NTP transferase domain-containing protein [Parablastomonas sp. CN1-191]|uniref:phosphocholine cytidylyltransferase family protein n=1 Tax=Parablastomonas sp. CN1-191 TaxID=3400908 RepID=UPI003BF8F9E7